MFIYMFNLLVILLEFTLLIGQVTVSIFHRVFWLIAPKRKKTISGKVVLITGAAQGLGRALALRFARLGAVVVAWDVNINGLMKTAREIKNIGGMCHIYQVDVSDAKRVEVMSERVLSEVGHVYILINNAAILHCVALMEKTDSEVRQTISNNLLSHFWTVRAFLPSMLSKGEGHIVAISSNLGIIGKSHFCDYAASKHGVNGFMESLADELYQMGKASQIKCTTVCPAVINTGLSKAVETRFPRLFPIMSPEYAAKKVSSAILRNESLLIIPRGYRYLYAAMRNCPFKVQQLLLDYIGNTVEID
ncbi:Epidermal retinol dehydrogenase 2 [Halotydeus destructor]|nr:Epidermal retinol dehydrogenase 2 [Halotydeus destructor]